MADAQTETTNGTKPRKTARRRTSARKRVAKRSTLAALNGNTRQMLEDGAGRAYRGASSAYSQGRRMAKRAYAAAGNAMHDMKMPGRSDITNFAEQNPLILGAVGLGLGVVIGTLLPRYSSMMPSMPAMSQTRASGGGGRRPARKAARKR
jgi:hypothetical protein